MYRETESSARNDTATVKVVTEGARGFSKVRCQFAVPLRSPDPFASCDRTSNGEFILALAIVFFSLLRLYVISALSDRLGRLAPSGT